MKTYYVTYITETGTRMHRNYRCVSFVQARAIATRQCKLHGFAGKMIVEGN